MENSHIEWTDHTFNPWEGCTKVSPGCLNCYAETRNKRFAEGKNWGKGAPRRRTSESNWNQPLKWNRDYERSFEFCDDARAVAPMGSILPSYPTRPRVFCASLADWLDDEVPIEWLADLLALIHATPNLDWLLLTKRPEHWKRRICAAMTHLGASDQTGTVESLIAWLDNDAPANVWIGTSVENQAMADQRIPALLHIPAQVRFLSCEPLLEMVNLTSEGILGPDDCMPRSVGYMVGRDDGKSPLYPTRRQALSGIHWVICGGESGTEARPMHPDWARSLRDQCQAAGIPFLFKQWGEWAPIETLHSTKDYLVVALPGGDGPNAETTVIKIGKKAAGRLLDGMEQSEFPKIEACLS